MYNFKIFDISALSAMTELFDVFDLGKHIVTYNIKSQRARQNVRDANNPILMMLGFIQSRSYVD